MVFNQSLRQREHNYYFFRDFDVFDKLWYSMNQSDSENILFICKLMQVRFSILKSLCVCLCVSHCLCLFVRQSWSYFLLFVCLSVSLCLLSVGLSVSICLLSVCLSVSILLSIFCVSVCQYFFSVCLSVSQYLSSVCLSISICLLSVCLSDSLCLSICLPVCVSACSALLGDETIDLTKMWQTECLGIPLLHSSRQPISRYGLETVT